ncbi:hypothetical protein D3C81_957320 [compost metagenome]
MNFLFPLDAVALQLKYRLDNFYLEVGVPHLIPEATMNKCRLLARAYFFKELRQWFLWYEYERNNRKLTREFGPYPKEFLEDGYIAGAKARLFPNDEYLHPQFKAMLRDEVSDPICCHINQILGNYFRNTNTWDVCLIKPLGENVILERKGDYRVWDWSNTNGHLCHPWNSSN